MSGTTLALTAILIVALVGQAGHQVAAQESITAAAPSHSTTIALTSDERRLIVVNREANSVSIIRVKNNEGNDVANKIAEIVVGEEPRCVAVNPDDRFAYVTNGISGTVSVVNLARHRVARTIDVGTEPRGCALTPNGTLLYVANHTEGTVAIIDTASRTVVGKVDVGRNPTAIAITNNGDDSDTDETVFVTQIFAELDPDFDDPFGVGGEMRDLGKRGVVQAFPVGNASPLISKITLSSIADSGFSASRVSFCLSAHPAHQANPVFCPNPDDVTDSANVNNPQGMFPNQLLSALIRGNRLYLPNIAAQPEPPERFNVNVQALVSAVDTNALAEVVDEAVNLNKQIDVETAAPPPSLDRTFANDIVAIDANLAGDTFVIVSRGGNQVFRARLDADGKLDILNAAKSRVDCRIQTGNLPSGIAMRQDGTRAYANNEANFSVTSMNIEDGLCLTLRRDIDSSEPPNPGSFEHAVLVGKLALLNIPGVLANEFKSFTCNGATFNYLEDVGTFDVDNPLELRDNATGSTAFGVNGLQPPSLFSINYHAPYLHRGQAPTLEDVFPRHALGSSTIEAALSAPERANLLVFLRSIDGTTATVPSEGDTFRDTLRLQGPCPPPSLTSP